MQKQSRCEFTHLLSVKCTCDNFNMVIRKIDNKLHSLFLQKNICTAYNFSMSVANFIVFLNGFVILIVCIILHQRCIRFTALSGKNSFKINEHCKSGNNPWVRSHAWQRKRALLFLRNLFFYLKWQHKRNKETMCKPLHSEFMTNLYSYPRL